MLPQASELGLHDQLLSTPLLYAPWYDVMSTSHLYHFSSKLVTPVWSQGEYEKNPNTETAE